MIRQKEAIGNLIVQLARLESTVTGPRNLQDVIGRDMIIQLEHILQRNTLEITGRRMPQSPGSTESNVDNIGAQTETEVIASIERLCELSRASDKTVFTDDRGKFILNGLERVFNFIEGSSAAYRKGNTKRKYDDTHFPAQDGHGDWKRAKIILSNATSIMKTTNGKIIVTAYS
jgi:hypothetical protein